MNKNDIKILIACEYSGVVRDAFKRLGFKAISSDLLETEVPGPHYCGDIRDIAAYGFTLLIAHPPCTYLCNGGLHWRLKDSSRYAKQAEALDFVRYLMGLSIPHKCIENPRGIIGSEIRKHDQRIHPWEFGEDVEQKETCLWLENLPKLIPERFLAKEQRSFAFQSMPPSEDRGKIKSKTFPGIAKAMAEQWGDYLLNL